MLFRLPLLLALAWLFCAPVAAVSAEVVLLHSESGPTRWNQRLGEGLTRELGDAAAVRQVFLKADGTDEDAYDEVYRKLAEALAGDAPEVVVADGPVAFAFARKYGGLLFGQAPTIFCGMARPDPQEMAECGACTGIPEGYAVKGSVDLIFAMRPDTRLVVAVADGGPETVPFMDAVNLAMKSHFDRAQVMFPGFEPGDERRLSLKELGDTLASVPSTGAVLFLGFGEDRDGNPVSDEELAALIRERAAAPVYLLSDGLLGSGAVGGLLVTARDVGADAARLAKRVLGGESVSEMLPQATRPKLHFDGTALARYGMKAPEGAEVINPPVGRVEERSVLPVTGLAWAMGLAFAVALLMLLRRRYRP